MSHKITCCGVVSRSKTAWVSFIWAFLFLTIFRVLIRDIWAVVLCSFQHVCRKILCTYAAFFHTQFLGQVSWWCHYTTCLPRLQWQQILTQFNHIHSISLALVEAVDHLTMGYTTYTKDNIEDSGLIMIPHLSYVENSKSPKHKLDLYLPPNSANHKHPVVIFVHGGGWKRGDRRWFRGMYANVGWALAKQGFACAVISYRLVGVSRTFKMGMAAFWTILATFLLFLAYLAVDYFEGEILMYSFADFSRNYGCGWSIDGVRGAGTLLCGTGVHLSISKQRFPNSILRSSGRCCQR